MDELVRGRGKVALAGGSLADDARMQRRLERRKRRSRKLQRRYDYRGALGATVVGALMLGAGYFAWVALIGAADVAAGLIDANVFRRS